jgi:hypothetical protein
MTVSLLPSNATALERGLDLAGADLEARIAPGAEAIAGWKLDPQPALAPWLIHEYGLAPLTPFVPNLYDLLGDGIAWERLRGTHAGMAIGLGFVGYSAELVDPPARRLAWADYQLTLDRVRDEAADLPRIDGIARLSQPARSHFRRGVCGYDVPAAEASWTRLSGSILGDDSGRHVEATGGTAGPKWSYGRNHDAEVTLSQADLETLGIWIEGGDSGAITWADLNQPWNTVNDTWAELGEAGARLRQMASALGSRSAWLGLYRGDGSMIGARRCLAFAQAAPAVAGPYAVAGQTWAPNPDGSSVLAIARTDFGDGAGEEVSEVALLVDARPADPARPGKLWLAPDEIGAPVPPVARTPVSITLGETVRDRFALLVGFS